MDKYTARIKADALREFAEDLDRYAGTILNAESAAQMARVKANSIEGKSRVWPESD